MGPKNQYTAYPRDFDESDIDRTPEYEAFIEELRKLQEERGVTGNLEPDIQRKKVDLLKLYKIIIERGGYSVVSETTGLWKELAVQFNPPQHNTNIGFVLKTIYWKNLAAYECIHHWKVDPPKPEVLEQVTAAGTDLVGKVAPPAAESSATPGLLTRGRSGTGEEPAAASTPSGRTLREAPPKRQFFQPAVSTPKPRSVATSAQSPTPQPTMNGKSTSSNNSMGATGQHSNGPPPPPLSLKSVITPYSHPRAFVKPPASANMYPMPQLPPNFGISSLFRSVMAIRSGLEEEVTWGLQTLLAKSIKDDHRLLLRDEPQLASDLLGLIVACIDAVDDRQVGKPVTQWPPSAFSSQSQLPPGTYNPVSGTLYTDEWTKKMEHGLHAADIIRNIISDPTKNRFSRSNVKYFINTFPHAVAVLVSALKTPAGSGYDELRLTCLHILESVSRIIDIDHETDIIELLWPIITSSEDRSAIVASLGILVNFSLAEKLEYLKNIPDEARERIEAFLFLKDEKLLIPTLDFLYHYTLIPQNVVTLANTPTAVQGTFSQLSRLLTHGLFKISPPIPFRPTEQRGPKKTPAEVTPNLPADLLNDILNLAEPQRAIWWMRSSFEANGESEITQIALWQAYQQRFGTYHNTGPRPQAMLQANDFIKNVSVAFPNAKPQMIKGQNNTPNRFVINGIAPREEPMGLDYNTYLKCQWHLPRTESASPNQSPSVASTSKDVCGEFFPTSQELFTHVRDEHTFLKKGHTGTTQKCEFGDCKKFQPEGTTEKQLFFSHLMGHMPDKKREQFIKSPTGETYKIQAPKKPTDSNEFLASLRNWTYFAGPPQDIVDDAAGIHVMASKVLLNISKIQPDGAAGLVLIKEYLTIIFGSINPGFQRDILSDVITNITRYEIEKVPAEDIMMIDSSDDQADSPYPSIF